MPATAEEFLGPAAAAAASPAPYQGMADAYNSAGLQTAIKIQSEDLGKQLEEQSFLKRNASMDVPLEAKSGLPAWLRFNLAMEPDLQHQKQYLLNRPDVLGVRETDDKSNLIVRLRDDTNKNGVKDYLAHPIEFTGKSLASAAGALLSSIPTIAATAMVPEAKAAGVLAQGAKMLGATVAAGTATDTLVRAGQGTDPAYAEQLSRRVPEGLMNAALPMGFQALNRVQSPFGSYAGPQQRLLADAVESLKKETGVGINLTAAQRTGSPFLARYESFVSKLPGGGQMKTEQAAQDEAIRRTQMEIAAKTGGADVSQSDIGKRAGGLLSAEDQAAQGKIDVLRSGAQTGAQDNLMNLVAKMSSPNASLTGSEVGGAVRQRLTQLRQEFEDTAQKNYAAAKTAIGPDDSIVPLKPIQDFAQKLKEGTFEASQKLSPGRRKAIDLPKDILSELGINPEEGPTLLDAFGRTIDTATISAPSPNLSLTKVRDLRSLIGASLAKGDPIGELSDADAKGLYKTLSESIDQGIDSLKNPEAKALLTKANTEYKQGVEKFEQTGVGNLFREDSQSGFRADPQIPEKVFGDIDQMKRYKDLLGEHSPEYQGILRVGLDNIVARSQGIGSNFIDAGDFLKNLTSFKKNSPEAFHEVFGGNLDEVLKNTRLLQAAQNAKIDGATLDQIIKSDPVKIGPMLQTAVNLEKTRDAFYANKVVRDLLDGQLKPAQLNPEEFVSRFIMGTTPKDAGSVMAALAQDPQVTADIRRKTVEEILQQSARPTQASDIVARQIAGNNAVPVDATKLSNLLASKGAVLREVLDPQTYELLDKYLTVEGSRLNAQTMGGQAGSLKNASIMAAFLDGFRGIPELASIAKFKLMAMALSSRTFQNIASRTVDLNAITPMAIKRAVYSSPEVMHMIAREAQTTPEIIPLVDYFTSEGAGATGGKKHSAEEFLGKSPAPVTPAPASPISP